MNNIRDGQSNIEYIDYLAERNERAIKAKLRMEESEKSRANERFMFAQLVLGFLVIIATFLAVMIFFTFPVKAWSAEIESAHIALHGPTYHFDRHRDWDGRRFNESNWGAGLRLQAKRGWSVQIGAYENSYSGIQKDGSNRTRISAYAVIEIPLGKTGDMSAGGFAGATHNYPYHNGGVVPVGGLWGRADGLWHDTALTMRLMPPVHPKVSGAITIEPSIKVWSK